MASFLKCASIGIALECRDILFRDFDWNNDNYPIKPSHFLPVTKWARSFFEMEDLSNGDTYLNDSPKTKWLKCFGLFLATPIVHAVGTVLNVANRIVKLVTFSHFWVKTNRCNYSFSLRCKEFGKDILRVALTPILFAGLELSALYGLLRPYDGGKLYATFERAIYGKSLLAPCFQPNPDSHLGGGDINTPDIW